MFCFLKRKLEKTSYAFPLSKEITDARNKLGVSPSAIISVQMPLKIRKPQAPFDIQVVKINNKI